MIKKENYLEKLSDLKEQVLKAKKDFLNLSSNYNKLENEYKTNCREYNAGDIVLIHEIGKSSSDSYKVVTIASPLYIDEKDLSISYSYCTNSFDENDKPIGAPKYSYIDNTKFEIKKL